jgi:hypothetical protein
LQRRQANFRYHARALFTQGVFQEKVWSALVVFNQWKSVDSGQLGDEMAAPCIMDYLVYTCGPNAETKAKTPLSPELSSNE